MTWLQGQIGYASPALVAALHRFISGWQAQPPDLGKINSAQRQVKRLCARANA